jgi:YD repeat-containing protein
VEGVPDNQQIWLSWTAPLNNGGAEIWDYAIEYSSNSGVTWLPFNDGNSAAARALIYGLVNGTSYLFRVAAINQGGTGSYTQSIQEIIPRTFPSPPTAVTGAAGDGKVILSWTAPGSNGGSAITDYVIEYSPNGTDWTPFNDGTSTAVSATVTNLTNGIAYFFRVAAVNAAGNGYSSENSPSYAPYTVPEAPTTVSGTPGNGEVGLSWTAPRSNGGSAITNYSYQFSSNGGATWSASALTNSTSASLSVRRATNATSDIFRLAANFTVQGLTNGVSYIFRIAAVNAAGTGEWKYTDTVTPLLNLGILPSPQETAAFLISDNHKRYAENFCASGRLSSGSAQSGSTVKQCYRRVSPCTKKPGTPEPDLGSGMCTGNYQTVLEIPYVGAFIHNSNAPYRWRGFGSGFDFESERRVLPGGPTTYYLNLGDGTTITLIPHTSPGVYRAQDLRLNNSLFYISSLEATEITPENETIVYRPTSRSGGFEIAEIRDSYGIVNAYTRLVDGRLESIKNQFEQKIQFTYDSNGNLAEVLDFAGNKNTFEMISQSNLYGQLTFFLKRVNLSANSGKYELSFGEASVISPGNYNASSPALIYFGNVDRIVKVRNPNGSQMDLVYNYYGDLSGITDEKGQITTVGYSANEVTIKTLYSTMVETFANGKLVATSEKLNTESSSLRTAFSRDSLDRVTSIAYPNGVNVDLEYQCGSGVFFGGGCDKDDLRKYNIIKVTRSNGVTTQKTTMSYASSVGDVQFDIQNVEAELPDGKKVTSSFSYYGSAPYHRLQTQTVNGVTTSYVYNDKGDLTSITNPEGTVTLEYNELGLMTSESDVFSRKTTYGYDSFGNLTSITDSFGRTKSASFDPLGRVTQVNSPVSVMNKIYGPSSENSYQETSSVRLGNIITSVTTNSSFTTEGQAQSTRVDVKVGGNNLYQISQSYNPAAGFFVPSAVTVTTPTAENVTLKDSNNDTRAQASPVP